DCNRLPGYQLQGIATNSNPSESTTFPCNSCRCNTHRKRTRHFVLCSDPHTGQHKSLLCIERIRTSVVSVLPNFGGVSTRNGRLVDRILSRVWQAEGAKALH